MSEEWYAAYGLKLAASGGFEDVPRIFDSSNPINDPDLGTPNEACTNPGPGIGEGGFPSNCEAQYNVLVIEETGGKYADDNEKGGTISFIFKEAVDVSAIGLLDIDDGMESSITAILKDGSGADPIPVPAKGDNSYQTVNVNLVGVTTLNVNFEGSGAVAFISFCYW